MGLLFGEDDLFSGFNGYLMLGGKPSEPGKGTVQEPTDGIESIALTADMKKRALGAITCADECVTGPGDPAGH